jgi:hypothetical protein
MKIKNLILAVLFLSPFSAFGAVNYTQPVNGSIVNSPFLMDISLDSAADFLNVTDFWCVGIIASDESPIQGIFFSEVIPTSQLSHIFSVSAPDTTGIGDGVIFSLDADIECSPTNAVGSQALFVGNGDHTTRFTFQGEQTFANIASSIGSGYIGSITSIITENIDDILEIAMLLVSLFLIIKLSKKYLMPKELRSRNEIIKSETAIDKMAHKIFESNTDFMKSTKRKKRNKFKM